MAVGDPVDPSQIRGVQHLVRILAQPRRTVASATGLTDSPIFVATALDDQFARRAGILRRLLRLGRSPHRGAKLSLLAALNAAPDVQIYGTERWGLEAVAVPFGHVCIIATADACDIERLTTSAVRARIEGEFGPFVDPMLGVRAALYRANELHDRHILAFFGRAVFVPGPDDRPVGRIAIEGPAAAGAGPPDDERSELRLPDRRPAALYRGQAGIAFARSELSAPATSSLLPEGPIAFILSAPEGEDGLRLIARDMTLAELQPAPSEPRTAPFPVIRPSAPHGDENAAFEMFAPEGGERLLRVGVTLDARPSRLMPDPPDDACFAIVAVMAPQDTRARAVDRWWLDLDRRDRLVASAMTWRATTVICTDDRLEVYDWRERRFDQAQASRFETQRVDSESGRGSMLRRVDGQPFGFIAVPPRTVAASFDQRWWHHELWAFDWLDFSGAVESPGGDSQRLAADTQSTHGAIRMPGRVSSPVDQTSVQILDSARSRFGTGWGGELASDATFRVGPLVLAFRRKEG